MDRHTAYARRLEQASRREKVFAALAVAGVAVGVAGTLMPPDLSKLLPALPGEEAPLAATGSYLRPTAAAHSAPPAAQAPVARKVYPYSIIPGGVADSAELARVIRSDWVVGAHYAGFDVANAHAVTVTTPRAVYVSYRKGDQVYWTKKKIMLAQGETLLSDGKNEMRARCANRISDVPQFPVESHGPSEAELDTVVADAGEGGLMAVAAGMPDLDGGEAGGQRFQTTSFANGAGLALPLDTSMPTRTVAQVPAAQGLSQTPMSYGGRLGGGGGDTAADTTENGSVMPVTFNPGADNQETGKPGDDGTPPTAVTPSTPATPSTPTPGADPQPPVNPEMPTPAPGQPTVPGDTVIDPQQPAEVPEPGTLWLSGAALAAMAWLRRKGPRVARR